MDDIEQLTRGWRKLEKGEIIQAGDCFIHVWASEHRFSPCTASVGCENKFMDIYRRTDAELILMLNRASMWIRTAGEHGFADEINQLITERT